MTPFSYLIHATSGTHTELSIQAEGTDRAVAIAREILRKTPKAWWVLVRAPDGALVAKLRSDIRPSPISDDRSDTPGT